MFYKGRRVLVTGGTGFVGANCVEELLRREAKIRVPVFKKPLKVGKGQVEEVQADLRNEEDCLRVMKDIDFVCHCAGPVINATNSAPIDHIVANLVLCARVLQGAWKTGVERVVIFSSHTAYPPSDHPIKEEELWTGQPYDSYYGYGWMRRYMEKIAEFTNMKSKTKVAIVRPTAVYGPWDNFDLATSHVIPALVRKAVEHMNPYVVWGSGEEIRDFLYVKDLIKGALLLMEKYATGDPVNIGYGKPFKIKEAVDIILKAANYADARIEFDRSKPIAIPVRIVDTNKAKKLLGFEPGYTLEQGLTETVKWYEKMRKSGYVN